jgi:hypothetical protein
MRMYYREAGTNRVTVSETTVTYDTNVYANPFQLVDSELIVPVVEGSDPWAGQNIGIEFVSNVMPQLIGGVWDLDNVRLREFVSPTLVEPAVKAGQPELTVLSDPGAALEVLASTNASLAFSNWVSLGIVTNVTGSTNLVDTGGLLDQRYYVVRQLP